MTEEYLQLYKKYRPKTWNSLVGQESVAKSLQASVKNNKLPTGFLFSGPRGTGKTSAAVLLSKALNCENPPGDGNPCNECDMCETIDENNQHGVRYISMANQQSVDNVRALVEQARISQPVKKQVFILDEVHNLSKQGFDALLIPLEARDMPALFILCSTEEHKIPDTILSRVQKRNFSLVSDEDMARLLKAIEAREGVDLTDEERASVIRQGRGSARDTLTALETFIEVGNFQDSLSTELLEAVFTTDTKQVFKVIAEASLDGDAFVFRDLAEQLFADARDLLLLAAGADDELVPVAPVEDVKDSLRKLAGQHGITKLLERLGDALKEMAFGADGRVHLEIALVGFFDDLKRVKAALAKRAEQ